jgi:hypothetical protein
MKKEINLEEILRGINNSNSSVFGKEVIFAAMREAVKQAVEMSAEDANMDEDFGDEMVYNATEIKVLDVYSDTIKVITINKQSILDTINKII